jgi:hypothetical protein
MLLAMGRIIPEKPGQMFIPLPAYGRYFGLTKAEDCAA